MAIFDHASAWLAALAVSGTGISFAVWALGRILPGLVVGELAKLFGRLRSSAWLHDTAHPKRMAAYKALLEVIEEELPEDGEHEEFYEFMALWISEHVRLFVGSAKALEKALRGIGDKIDHALDEEIAAIGGKPQIPGDKKGA